jgi:uncharacterized DUF497 family protein
MYNDYVKIKGFNWDSGNTEKCQKHGLKLREIEDFLMSNPYVRFDDRHSEKEDRYIAFDRFKDSYLFVSFTFRVIDGSFKLRVISARYAQKKELEKFYGKKK